MRHAEGRGSSRASNRRLMAWLVRTAVLAALLLSATTPLAQQQRVHLNPVIAKLVEGKTV